MRCDPRKVVEGRKRQGGTPNLMIHHRIQLGKDTDLEASERLAAAKDNSLTFICAFFLSRLQRPALPTLVQDSDSDLDLRPRR